MFINLGIDCSSYQNGKIVSISLNIFSVTCNTFSSVNLVRYKFDGWKSLKLVFSPCVYLWLVSITVSSLLIFSSVKSNLLLISSSMRFISHIVVFTSHIQVRGWKQYLLLHIGSNGSIFWCNFKCIEEFQEFSNVSSYIFYSFPLSVNILTICLCSLSLFLSGEIFESKIKTSCHFIFKYCQYIY